MSEQDENESLCELLLGWKRIQHSAVCFWNDGLLGSQWPSTPTFLNGDGMLMLLYAIQRQPSSVHKRDFKRRAMDVLKADLFNPTEIRAAALAYIRSQS